MKNETTISKAEFASAVKSALDHGVGADALGAELELPAFLIHRYAEGMDAPRETIRDMIVNKILPSMQPSG